MVLDAFVANGGNFIDTADVYHGGRSEEVVGLWLEKQPRRKQARSSVVIATKVFFGGPGPNDGGLSKIHLMDGVAKSLARLRTTYIDVYQIHAWDAQTPPDEWLRTMLELVQAGKIRTVGVSNVTGWQLQKIVMIARDLGVPLASLQTQCVPPAVSPHSLPEQPFFLLNLLSTHPTRTRRFAQLCWCSSGCFSHPPFRRLTYGGGGDQVQLAVPGARI